MNRYGADPVSVAATVGWSRDSRDNSLAPTRGVYQRLNGEVGLPGMDIEYYKFTYQYQHYFPLSRTWTLAFNGEVGYGDVYGQTDMFPFFKNFYVGGIGSVRGFESGTLGPKDSTNKMNDDADNLGGDRMVNASLELLAPLPGGDRTLREVPARGVSSPPSTPATPGATKASSTPTAMPTTGVRNSA